MTNQELLLQRIPVYQEKAGEAHFWMVSNIEMGGPEILILRWQVLSATYEALATFDLIRLVRGTGVWLNNRIHE